MTSRYFHSKHSRVQFSNSRQLAVVIILIMFVFGTTVSFPKPVYANSPPTCLPTVPNFHVSVTTTRLTLAAGEMGSSVITVTPYDGFTGTAVLQFVIVDPALTATFSATTLDMSNGPQSSVLTIKTSSSITSGTYQAEINVTGSSIPQTWTFTVRVPQPELGITGPSTYVILERGTNGTATISLNAYYGLTDTSVALTASVLPGNPSNTPPTVSVDSSATLNNGAGSATVNVTTGASTSVATYVVQVIGTTSPSSVTNSTEFYVYVIGPSFDITITPQVTSVDAGATTTSTINVTSIRGFAGVVTLTPTVSPSVTNGPTATLGQSSLMLATAGSQQTTTLTVTTSTSTPPQEYSISLKAMAGLIANFTYLDLTVRGPGFSMSASPNPINLAKGGSQASSTITLASRGGFADQVGFIMSCVPDGLTGSLSVENVTLTAGGTATATLTVSSFAWTLPGRYDIYVDAFAFAGPQTNETDITVNVTGPDFSFSLTPPTISFTAGSSATSTVQLASLDGFAGSVRLTASVNSPGLNATLNTSTVVLVSGGTGTATLTVSGGTLGRYSVTVSGANGTLLRSTGFNVQVTAVGSPDFGVSSSSGSVTVHPGSSGTCTISVGPSNGFTGIVYLSIYSLPSSVNSTLSAYSIAGGSGSATLTLKAPSNATLGSYTVTVLATSGYLAHYTTVTVVVSNAGPGNIMGLDPVTFYAIIAGMVAAGAILVAYIVLRSRRLRGASPIGTSTPPAPPATANLLG